MIKIKLLLSLFIGVLTYTLLSLIAGQNGVHCYNQLKEQKNEIAYKTQELENINNELNLEYTALLKDKDIQASYARRLGYIAATEKLVKINGLKPYQKSSYTVGSLTRHQESTYISEKLCKMCAVVFFSLSFILMLFIDIAFPEKDSFSASPA